MGELFGGLTTRGRCLLAAGFAAAACSIVIEERDLLRVAAFIIALPLLAAQLARSIRVGLRATRELDPPRVPVGSRSSVLLTLRTQGALPFAELTLTDVVPRALGQAPRLLVERLTRSASGHVRYDLAPTRRGAYQVGPLRARIGDPLGLAEFDRELAGTDRVLVVPHHVTLTGLPPGAGMAAGTEDAAAVRPGYGDYDVLLRAYRSGDDMRRVHWRSTARRGELMVRLEEQPWRAGAAVLLDTRSQAYPGGGDCFEWAVSLAASISLHLLRHGHTVRLISESGVPIADTAVVVDERTSGAGAEMVLEALAMVTTSPRPDITVGADPATGCGVVAVLGGCTPATVGELLRLRPTGLSGTAILLDVGAWAAPAPAPAETAALLRGAGWRVTIAGPADSLSEVWDRVCGRVPNDTEPVS